MFHSTNDGRKLVSVESGQYVYLFDIAALISGPSIPLQAGGFSSISQMRELVPLYVGNTSANSLIRISTEFADGATQSIRDAKPTPPSSSDVTSTPHDS